AGRRNDGGSRRRETRHSRTTSSKVAKGRRMPVRKSIYESAFLATNVGSSAALPLPTFFVAWIVPAGMNQDPACLQRHRFAGSAPRRHSRPKDGRRAMSLRSRTLVGSSPSIYAVCDQIRTLL